MWMAVAVGSVVVAGAKAGWSPRYLSGRYRPQPAGASDSSETALGGATGFVFSPHFE
jgi:hypothetical protein